MGASLSRLASSTERTSRSAGARKRSPGPGLRTNLRKIRYGARGVSVHGYSRERIGLLARASGMDTIELAPLGRAGYILLARNELHRVRGARHPADDPATRH